MCFKYFKNSKKMIVILITIIFFIISDRLLKFLAINHFFIQSKEIIGNFFKLNYISNYNIAFSLPLSGWWLNIVIILTILALIHYLIYLIIKKDQTKVSLVLLIIIGASSNLFDRIKYGYVIDYLDLKYFTIFNLADVMIVFGVVCLGWIILNHSNK